MWHPLCFKSFGREVSLNIAAARQPKCAVFNRFWNKKVLELLEGSGNGRGMIDSPYGSLKVLGGRTLTIQNVSGLKSGTDSIWFCSTRNTEMLVLNEKDWSSFFLLLTLPVWHQAQFSFWSNFFEQKHPDWTFVLLSSDVNCCLFHGLGSFIPVARWRGQLGCGDIGDQQSWKGVPKATFFEALPWRWSSGKREYVHNMYMYNVRSLHRIQIMNAYIIYVNLDGHMNDCCPPFYT